METKINVSHFETRKSGDQLPAGSKSASPTKSAANYQPAIDKHIADTKATEEADLEQISLELGVFATTKCKLDQEQLKIERGIRDELISVERAIFCTALERGKVLLKYHDLYGPLGKFKGFLDTLGVSRATAYRHMAEAAGMLEPPSPKTAPKKVSKPVRAYQSFKRVLIGSPKPSATEEEKADRVLKAIATFVRLAVKDIPSNAQPAFCERVIREVSEAMSLYAAQIAARLPASADVPLPAEAQADLGAATVRDVVAQSQIADLGAQ
jgi:hypothetical protein